MERMWRRVSGKQTRKVEMQNEETGSDHVKMATSSSTTGKRLASSGNLSSLNPLTLNDTVDDATLMNCKKTLSQYVVQKKQYGIERSRRKRLKTRANRLHGINCVSGNGDMSSSGGFYSLKEGVCKDMMGNSSFVPTGTVLMYPSHKLDIQKKKPKQQQAAEMKKHQDVSIRQRAVAKLRMFNFSLNWDVQIPNCKPCGAGTTGRGNIITRRLCRSRGREDNELYRSNSFKFERFDRKESLEVLALAGQKQVAICDDYSLPVDFVKRRPSSFDPCLVENLEISTDKSQNITKIEKAEALAFKNNSYESQTLSVEVGKTDSTPTKKSFCDEEEKLQTVKDGSKNKVLVKRRKKRRRCKKKCSITPNILGFDGSAKSKENISSDSSIPRTSEEDLFVLRESDVDSTETTKKAQQPFKNLFKKKHSPYYYSDLMRNFQAFEDDETNNVAQKTETKIDDKSVDVSNIFKRFSFTEEGVHIIRCESPTSTSEDSDCSECQSKLPHNQFLGLVHQSLPKLELKQFDGHPLSESNICDCFMTKFIPDSKRSEINFRCSFCNLKEEKYITQEVFDPKETSSEMSVRRRKLYETAFDSKVTKSDDDLVEVDRITNHSLIFFSDNFKEDSCKIDAIETSAAKYETSETVSSKTHAIYVIGDSNDSKSNFLNETQPNEFLQLTDDMNNLEIENMYNNESHHGPHILLCSYKLSPPSTAPLPIKFNGKSNKSNEKNVQSKSQLLCKSESKMKCKGHQKQESNKDTKVSLETNNLLDVRKYSPEEPSSNINENNKRISMLHVSRTINSSKKISRGQKKHFSSNESMITLSSDGSVESLHSSTSEGNCSSSSSVSRRSTSLSSHSSESNIAFHLRTPVPLCSKRHILSPISDKSSLEPNLELLEQNKNPEEIFEDSSEMIHQRTDKSHQEALRRKKIASNKFIQNLVDELPCSDSGISIHSREETKILSSANTTSNRASVDEAIKDRGPFHQKLAFLGNSILLPLDVSQLKPKRNKEQENFTSGSATSVDLGDLPFDMPKLKKKLRTNQMQINFNENTESSGLSQASSSHSIQNERCLKSNEKSLFRRNLTLNFNECRTSNKFSSLDIRGLTLSKEIGTKSVLSFIDTSIPLERQGWYHGAITRIDAESTLRPLNEGSFLVRNCESAKQDYSLSLKGAKGFMHMRIQRNETGHYVLGQFSRPFDSVPNMIRHFCLNRLPVRGAEHMCLLQPVISQEL